jgi:ADP-ribosylglycohydrolase
VRGGASGPRVARASRCRAAARAPALAPRASQQVTHAHPEGQAGAIAVALAALYAWRSKNDARFGEKDLLDFVIAHLAPGERRAPASRRRALCRPTRASPSPPRRSARATASRRWTPCPSRSSAQRRHLDDLEEACWSTVAGLGDRDTTCAIAGSIVVLRTGPSAIPRAWREAREPIEEEPAMERYAADRRFGGPEAR